MNATRDTAALLLLQRLAKPRRAAELLEQHGEPLAALRAINGTGQLALDTADPASHEAMIDEVLCELQELAAESISLLTVLDEGYPRNLRLVYDRPLILWVRGALSVRDDRSVAVVGTRRASSAGLEQARQIAHQLVEAGCVVVSGLAAGIDTAAQTATLEAGGRTIAVIGTGLQHAFPKQSADLQRRLGLESAVLSQFEPDQEARKWTFPMRNAVMSGLARATVVVEATYTSGARMQARLALEHGRPVVLMESLLEHEWARAYAARPGVYVVAEVAEVVDRLDRLYAPDLTLTA
ncbi:MAG TPA: DNA-processing protein DprA [Solirubrobacteraceae bacterium]|nr:DNA-processing protein DprA [Solirubrobacteraceae bacterium]